MMRADFHMHSTVSDGSLSIQELIARGKEKQLYAIAITDHDTLSQRTQIPDTDGIIVIPGIEVSAFDYDKNMRVHVLGYGIKKPEITEQAVLPTLEARHANSMRQIEILKEHGYEIDVNHMSKADGKYIYKQHIMDYLVTTGQAKSLFGRFYYDTFKNNGICHFDIRYPSPVTAVRAIKDAGGIAVLAHSGQQQNFELIPGLVKHGLDGLELNHHSHSERDREIIRSYAEKYNLILTGGSDFHGRFEDTQVDIGDYIAEESGVAAILGGGLV